MSRRVMRVLSGLLASEGLTQNSVGAKATVRGPKLYSVATSRHLERSNQCHSTLYTEDVVARALRMRRKSGEEVQGKKINRIE